MPDPTLLTRADIRRLLELLDVELAAEAVEGEVYLVGGAVMCLVFDARPATRDVDAYFRPTTVIRQAAARVAGKAGVPDTWPNDAVKGYVSPRGDSDPYLELPHLRVFVARPEYLLAMKCAAMRLGEEFRDLDDVRYLLRYLNIGTATRRSKSCIATSMPISSCPRPDWRWRRCFPADGFLNGHGARPPRSPPPRVAFKPRHANLRHRFSST